MQVKSGEIREDFFFRIHVISIRVPALEERKEDIPLLTAHFLNKLGDEKDITALPQELTRSMMAYDWPGNIRELQNFINRFLASADIEFFEFKDKAPYGFDHTVEQATVDDAVGHGLQDYLASFEKKIIIKTLQENNWHRGKTADALQIHYRSLLRKMKRHGIQLS